MRILLTSLIMTLTIISASAQKTTGMIGYTLTEIKAEFPDCTPPECKTGVADNGIKYFMVASPLIGASGFYFDEKDTCNRSIFIPVNDKTKNQFIETYNIKFVVKSVTEWYSYINGVVIDIILVYDSDNGNYYFNYTKKT